MVKVYVIGHKNPDTDSIVAAIGYAFFKSKIDVDDEYIPARAGRLNNETKYVLDRFQVTEPELLKDASNKKIILVDHNEMGQVVQGASEARIFEIIDHHKIGDLQTYAPIMFHAEPVGSTSTIVTDFLKYHKIKIPNKIAGLLLAGILSDTVIFKSPTTTEKDKLLAKELSKQTGLDIQEFGLEIKKAKSSIKGMSAHEIIMSDFKSFEKNGYKYGIGQIEVVDEAEAVKRKQEIINELKNIMDSSGFRMAALMITNIFKEATNLWFTGDKKLIKKAFGKKPKNNEVFLPEVMSRKKQVNPPIEKIL